MADESSKIVGNVVNPVTQGSSKFGGITDEKAVGASKVGGITDSKAQGASKVGTATNESAQVVSKVGRVTDEKAQVTSKVGNVGTIGSANKQALYSYDQSKVEPSASDNQRFYSLENITGNSYFDKWPLIYRSIYIYIFNNPNKSISEIADATSSSEYEVTYVTNWLKENKIIGTEEVKAPVVTSQDVAEPKSWNEITETSPSLERKKISPSISIWSM